MIAFLDSVHADMEARSATGDAGDFLAQEEIGVAAQRFDGIDGIVIGDGDQIHAALFQERVDLMGVVIAFPADPVEQRDGTHAGVDSVDVQIAPHARLYQCIVTIRGPAEETFVTYFVLVDETNSCDAQNW